MNDSCLISVLYQSYTYETVLRLVSHISFSVSRLLRMIKGGFQMSDAMPVNTTFNRSLNGIIMAINNQHPHQHESSLMQHYHFLQRAQAITSLALSSYCWMLTSYSNHCVRHCRRQNFSCKKQTYFFLSMSVVLRKNINFPFSLSCAR